MFWLFIVLDIDKYKFYFSIFRVVEFDINVEGEIVFVNYYFFVNGDFVGLVGEWLFLFVRSYGMIVFCFCELFVL